MALGLQRSGDWLAALRSDHCAAPPANHCCAVGLLPLQREEFRLSRALIYFSLGHAAPGGLTSGSAMPV